MQRCAVCVPRYALNVLRSGWCVPSSGRWTAGTLHVCRQTIFMVGWCRLLFAKCIDSNTLISLWVSFLIASVRKDRVITIEALSQV